MLIIPIKDGENIDRALNPDYAIGHGYNRFAIAKPRIKRISFKYELLHKKTINWNISENQCFSRS